MTTSDEIQATPLHGQNLILDVENFGPIAAAKNIEFKPMTVLVGPSNTGKTYLAMLLHSFAQAINESNRTTEGFQPRHDTQPRRFDQQQQSDVINDFKNLGRLFSHGSSPDGASWDRVPFAAFSSSTQKVMSSQLDDHRDRVARSVTETVLDFFAVESLLDLSNGAEPARPVTLPKAEFRVNSIQVSIEYTGTHIRRPPMGLKIPPAYVDYRAMNELESNPDEPRLFVAEIEGLIAINYADLFSDVPISFYLPAGRTGLLDTRESMLAPISRGLLGENMQALKFARVKRAARVCIDLLNGARQRPSNNISDRPTLKSHDPFRRRTSVRRIADLLAQSLIDGQIFIETSNGATEIQYAPEGLSIPISRASSMVNEVAPILIFLRNYVAKGDLIIIDEPEAHLHPAAQQQMAAALAFMVRSGLRVLITTHSHYMVEQLSNFVMVSGLDDPAERKRLLDIQRKLGEEDVFLLPDEVAVYDFAPQSTSGGSMVTEVAYEDGYYPEDHIRAIGAQFNRNNRIETAVLGPE